ncbi:redoxin domain-containing protein [Candidatus Palauibacter sp.]|uniref:redoxin domain-containing protein n=1 Tax=Candidatus Palauibacter sp. TaxID=3101350 RepID=UPI003B01A4A0
MRSLTFSWAGLAGIAVLAGCADARPHAELMADAAADVEAIRLERAMVRYDSARTAAPGDAEAHRQYATLADYFGLFADASRAWEQALELEPGDPAAWDGYMTSLRWAARFETDRRYAEKLLDRLPEALRATHDRPMIYVSALLAARELGDLGRYRTILTERLAAQPGDPVILSALGAALVEVADEEGGNRSQAVRDSIEAALDALAADERDRETPAPILYRLASGYDLIGREDESDRWLASLVSAPDRGVLADDLLAEDLSSDFQAAFQRASPAELVRIADDGLAAATTLKNRATWTTWRLMAVGRQAMGPEADPAAKERVFATALDVLAWQNAEQQMALDGLAELGLHPEIVLEKTVEVERGLRADRPGFLYPGARGDEREESRQRAIDRARIIQARMLARLGETEAAGTLFEELATESRGTQTLQALGNHLLATDRPTEALDAFVEAIAFGNSRLRPLAERAAAAADLPPEAVEERLTVRRPAVEAELAERALGERLDRAAPALALQDRHGVEWQLSDLAGKVVVLKFWATWCPPCLAEFPDFTAALEAYEGDEEVVFLTIVTADSPRIEVDELLAREGYTFPVLFDEGGLALDYRIFAYPTTFYVDPDGVIRFMDQGYRPAGYAERLGHRIDALRSQ